jgi:hypothetical protein
VHLEFFAAVPADDQDLGPLQRAGHRAEDPVDGLAVLDLSLGSIERLALSQ